MTDVPDPAQSVDYKAIGELILGAITDNPNISFDGLRGLIVSANTQSHGAKISASLKFVTWLATQMGDTLRAVEEPFLPVVSAFVAPLVSGMFGSEIDADAFAARSNGPARNAAARAMVDTFLNAITDEAPEPSEPGQEGARRLASAGLHATLEGWFLATVPEILSDLLPFEMGHFDEFRRLPEDVIATLGVGRLIRRALGPLVNATAVQPMTWATNQKYRPTRLAPATLIREYFRGNIDDNGVRDELAIAGYRDGSMEALINEQRKFLDAGDLAFLVVAELLAVDEAIQTLQDQGFDRQTASKHFNVQTIKRDDAIHRELATAAESAYADRLIDDGQLDDVLSATVTSATERQLRADVARGRRALRVKFLSAAQAEACVKADVLPLSEYRAALEREGYVSDAIDALEMLLRAALDKTANASDLKAAQQTAKDAAAAAKAKTAAAHAQQVDQAAAVKAFGPIGVLKDAVIRGLVPIQRLQDALTLQFPADTVAITLDDVETKRAAYVAAQQKAADATKRATNKGLSVAQLQAALNDRILTIDQVADSLTAAGTPDADVAILRQVMVDKATQVQAANALHVAAARKSVNRPIPLTKADALVKGGHWTLAQYNDYLSTLGYGAGDVANLDVLIKDALAKANAAASIQQQTTTADGARGLSLAQFRSAVVLGTKTVADYQQFLVGLNFSADAISTLVADAQDALTTANAARARRMQAGGALDGHVVPLADLTRAAQLGLLAPADYQAALVAHGYSPEDAALESDLLTTELRAAGGAVRVGTATGLAAAQAKHVDIDGQLTLKGLSLAKTEKAVTDGLMTLDAYQAWLEANGYSAADAGLLRALLATAIAAKGGAAAAGDAGSGVGP